MDQHNTQASRCADGEEKSVLIRLTEEEIRRLLKLLDDKLLRHEASSLDLPLEGKLEGALMEAGSSP